MQKIMLIGELYREAKCTPRTVRHYENEKIIYPMDLTSGGHKLYNKDTVSIIHTVQLL